jgi:chromosome segregation ATPase
VDLGERGGFARCRRAADLGPQHTVGPRQRAEGGQPEQGGAGTVASSSKAAYEDLQQDLGTTTGDLAQTEQDRKDAEQAATKAEQDAAAANKTADQAKNETDKAKAEADQAKADAEAAQSKSAVVADCAKAYFSAFGALFEGESVEAQVPVVKKDLQSIADDCKTALGGT